MVEEQIASRPRSAEIRPGAESCIGADRSTLAGDLLEMNAAEELERRGQQEQQHRRQREVASTLTAVMD